MNAPCPWLLDGERVLWAGAPPRGLRFHAHDWELVPFSLLWAGFMVFWNVDVWKMGEDYGTWLARLWGLPFLVVGGFLVFGRFFLDAAVRRRQRYYVTDRRVLVVRSGWRGCVIAASLDFLPFVKLTERRNGSGDIRFGPIRYKRSSKTGQMIERDRIVPALNPTLQFTGIANVAAVHALIVDAVAAQEQPD